MTRRMLDDVDHVFDDSDFHYLHPRVREMWREQNPTMRSELDRFDLREKAKYVFVQELTRALSDAGVPLLLGTDSSAPGMYPGASGLVELRQLVEAGFDPFDALRAGTQEAGDFISEHVHGTRPLGTIAVGRTANLLLLEGNPLEDIDNVSMMASIAVRGRWFTVEEIQGLRSAAARSFEE
jgi:imidazolonepropionase-like amidohydrolase